MTSYWLPGAQVHIIIIMYYRQINTHSDRALIEVQLPLSFYFFNPKWIYRILNAALYNSSPSLSGYPTSLIFLIGCVMQQQQQADSAYALDSAPPPYQLMYACEMRK